MRIIRHEAKLMRTLDDLIEVVTNINNNVNVSLDYGLHDFLHRLEEIRAMKAFETFLRQFRSSDD